MSSDTPIIKAKLILTVRAGNIGNAKVAGMNEELGLTGNQYNMALTVFFFPYGEFFSHIEPE